MIPPQHPYWVSSLSCDIIRSGAWSEVLSFDLCGAVSATHISRSTATPDEWWSTMDEEFLRFHGHGREAKREAKRFRSFLAKLLENEFVVWLGGMDSQEADAAIRAVLAKVDPTGVVLDAYVDVRKYDGPDTPPIQSLEKATEGRIDPVFCTAAEGETWVADLRARLATVARQIADATARGDSRRELVALRRPALQAVSMVLCEASDRVPKTQWVGGWEEAHDDHYWSIMKILSEHIDLLDAALADDRRRRGKNPVLTASGIRAVDRALDDAAPRRVAAKYAAAHPGATLLPM